MWSLGTLLTKISLSIVVHRCSECARSEFRGDRRVIEQLDLAGVGSPEFAFRAAPAFARRPDFVARMSHPGG
jgi:hypothetical protein